MESYVLVTTHAGRAPQVARWVKTLEHVEDAEMVLGGFHDVVVGVRTDNYAELGRVVERIRGVEGVASTTTCEGPLSLGVDIDLR